MQEFVFQLDEVEYRMTPANAMGAWSALKNALKLAQGIQLGEDTTKIGESVLGALLAHLGSPEIKAIEDIVLNHTVANLHGQQYRLSHQLDKHFNQYRGHLFPVLINGTRYQFADFFIGGGGLLKDMLPSINPLNDIKPANP
ncbi:phage tail assembly chaperone [Avibacterium paragallinarum]|uniref:phage tail assembly chaperone n=1 Tax=Avibacterium paragallinarum TaxID=728 RepID=UPI00397E9052